MQPTFSVCIPAFNEQLWLPRCIEAVRAAEAHLGESIEIIVGDNMSTDGTAEVAAELGAKVVPVTKRCISAVRNGAAAAASGRYLAFIDADDRMSENLLTEIKKALDSGEYIGGGVAGIRFDRKSPGLWLSGRIVDLSVGLMGVSMFAFYTTPEAFAAAGGFDETLLSTEDAHFARSLKRLGKQRGLKYKNLRTAQVYKSARKFDEYGDWMVFRHPVKWLRACFNDAAVAQELWYRPRR